MVNTSSVLRAGPVRVEYENGFLRGVRLNGVEILRMIYFAVRDEYWQTAQFTIYEEEVEQSVDSFRVDYHWQTHNLGIDMAGQITITGESTGQITFLFAGEALGCFLKNRVGICVLHPPDGLTGQPVQVISPDGQLTEGQFPDYVSPYQPFLDISELRWQLASGLALKLNFGGDVFEMEDQRNWTDASFKTYSTPLALPFPVAMQPGETIRQRVIFRVENAVRATDIDIELAESVPASPGIPSSTGANEGVVKPVDRPRIGLGQRADWQTLSPEKAAQLRLLTLSHLRADIVLSSPDWQTGLTNAISDARLIGVSLELALFFGAEPSSELDQLVDFLSNDSNLVSSVLLFNADTLVTSDALLDWVIGPLRRHWPNTLLGGGTDGAFVDFNRNRFQYERVDFVVYSISPQVHASDNRTLLENIAGQAPTVRTAHYITGNKPVHISPVTLRPRFMTLSQAQTNRQTPPEDVRQVSEFGITWTRLTVDALTQSGVASITFYETDGSRGGFDCLRTCLS